MEFTTKCKPMDNQIDTKDRDLNREVLGLKWAAWHARNQAQGEENRGRATESQPKNILGIYILRCLAVAAALAVVPCLATAEDSTAPTEEERIQLWTVCKPISLEVSVSDSDDEIALGFTEERVETLVRSRLQAAEIYDPDSFYTLRVWSYVVDDFFSLDLRFRKYLETTWTADTVGRHDYVGEPLLEGVVIYTDWFIDKYLRVNAEELC